MSIKHQASSLGQWVVPPWSILGSRGVLHAPEGCLRPHRDAPGSRGMLLTSAWQHLVGSIPLCLPGVPELRAGCRMCFWEGGDPSAATVTALSPLWYQQLGWRKEDTW